MPKFKAIVIRIICLSLFFTTIISFHSCRYSMFQLLTNNDVGYWEVHGSNIISAYSKKDSILEYLNDDLQTQSAQLLRPEKFHISKDTISHAFFFNNKICYYDTLLIVSYSRNKISFINLRDNYTTYFRRIKKKEIKQRKNGTYFK